MRDNPLVSVVIPVYNCEKYLNAAIDSVLAQTYQPLELIVIDDGSIDQSSEIAQSYGAKVKYFYIENSGLATALNHGISCCQGEYLAFLDADDLWIAEKLELQMAAFGQNHELEAVFGHLQQFKSPELDHTSKEKLKISVETAPAYHKDTMLIKREAMLHIGLFNSQIKVGDFIDWYLRAHEQGLKSSMLPNILAKRRLHQNNMGIKDRNYRIDYVRVIKASLDRRRQSGKINSIKVS